MTKVDPSTGRGEASRRTVLIGMAAAAAAPAPAIGSTEPDPIFAAIEAHKAAGSAFGDAVSAQGRLEKALPRENRRSFVCAFEEEIVETDDPRWISAVRAVNEMSGGAQDRALDLLDVRPTTRAGLVALFRHVSEIEEADLPSEVVLEEDDQHFSFEAALLRVAADWLEEGDTLRA